MQLQWKKKDIAWAYFYMFWKWFWGIKIALYGRRRTRVNRFDWKSKKAMAIFCIVFFLFVLENTWFKGYPQMQNQYCKNLGLLNLIVNLKIWGTNFNLFPFANTFFSIFLIFNLTLKKILLNLAVYLIPTVRMLIYGYYVCLIIICDSSTNFNIHRFGI